MDLHREVTLRRVSAVRVASWAMALARAMDSPRPWWSSTRAIESLEGLEEAVDLLVRDHRPGVRDGDDGLVALDPVETSTLEVGGSSPPTGSGADLDRDLGLGLEVRGADGVDESQHVIGGGCEVAGGDLGDVNAGLSYLLVLAWRAFLDSDDIVIGTDVHPAVETVARLLRADPGAGDLTTLADLVRLSPAHLSRLFRAQTGRSISWFRNQQRLRRLMLLYGDGRHTTALAAALEAGFGSYAQFHASSAPRPGKPLRCCGPPRAKATPYRAVRTPGRRRSRVRLSASQVSQPAAPCCQGW